jgi:hypothetical protein
MKIVTTTGTKLEFVFSPERCTGAYSVKTIEFSREDLRRIRALAFDDLEAFSRALNNLANSGGLAPPVDYVRTRPRFEEPKRAGWRYCAFAAVMLALIAGLLIEIIALLIT